MQGSPTPKQRQALAPEYLQQRQGRKAAGNSGGSNVILPIGSDASQRTGAWQRWPSLAGLADSLGCHVVVPPAHFEADDLIGALCENFARGDIASG